MTVRRPCGLEAWLGGGSREMREHAVGVPELIASGLGWPEGPTVLPDGRIVLVESYRSQLTMVGPDGPPPRFAPVAGAPNPCAPRAGAAP